MATWDKAASDARWHGEIIHDWPDAGECDYSYGYATSQDEPAESTLREMLPAGKVILEWKILPTPKNPLWTPSEESD